MNRKLSIKKVLVLVLIICMCMMLNASCFAAWWGTPGYEWALSSGITGAKSKSQLDASVELDDLYSTIVKYLRMKSITPKSRSIYHTDPMDGMDSVARGIAEIINGYNSRSSLTIQQFYIVENYVDKGYKTLETYRTLSQTLTREDLKNIETYLRLSKYKAATLVADRDDRAYALSRVGYIKNSGIVDYNIMPYTSKISRKEFLVLMYDLISGSAKNNMANADSVIQNFYNAGVLIGYDTGLELNKLLNYTEMYTFLYRFEIYDFDKNAEKNVFSDFNSYVSGAMSGTISKQALTIYLEDIAAKTNFQVDLLTRVENELGPNWTAREAAVLLNDLYTEEGFVYTDNNGNMTKVKR